MFETPAMSMMLVLVAAILGAAGQFLVQSGSKGVHSPISFLLNLKVMAGMGCYLAVMALFTRAFKLGGSVRVLYPIYASTFIWAAILAFLLHQQPIRPINILGMTLLTCGIVLMAR